MSTPTHRGLDQGTDRVRPDLEDLAAFVDGRLDGDLRAAVLARLDSDPDYYDTLVELTELRRELDAMDASGSESSPPQPNPQTPPGNVVRGPWRRSSTVVGAVATLAALLAIAVLLPLLRDPAPPDVGELVTSLGDHEIAGDLWAAPLGPTLRGSGDGAADQALDDEQSFLLGALMVDATWAARAAPERLHGRQVQLAGLLGGVGSYLADLPAERFAAEAPAEIDGLVDLGLGSPFFYRYGAWVRAAYWASASGRRDFFDSGAADGLAALRPTDDAALQREVDQLRALVEAGDLEALGHRLEQVQARRTGTTPMPPPVR